MAIASIGIFGGTFDPPHLGHLILAMEACSQLKLDRLFWVLTPDPPHKKDQVVTPAAIRLEMTHAITDLDPNFELCTVDLDRPSPHYALDTIRILKKQNPAMEFTYLIGGDSLHDLPDWHQPDIFIQEVERLGVMRREGDAVNLEVLELQFPGICKKLIFIDSPLIEISSTAIRNKVRMGLPFRYYVPPVVFELICKYDLYRQM